MEPAAGAGWSSAAAGVGQLDGEEGEGGELEPCASRLDAAEGGGMEGELAMREEEGRAMVSPRPADLRPPSRRCRGRGGEEEVSGV